MFGWLFGKDSGHATLTENQERARKQVEAEIQQNVGEPVLTMAKSILETDDWEVERDNERSLWRDVESFTLHHVKKDVNIRFTFTPSQTKTDYTKREMPLIKVEEKWETHCDWMTPYEKVYMANVFVQYRALQKQKADDAHAKKMAEERARVAALLNIEVPN